MSLEEKKRYGGMAVIEGVMMRGKDHYSVAVRKPDKTISVKTERADAWGKRWKGWKFPFVRGTAALIDSLYLGMKALTYSANESGEEEEELSKGELTFTIVAAISLGILLFMVLPTVVVHFSKNLSDSTIVPNILEGIVRLAVFFLYVWGISRIKDIQRVFAYHGAEHKVINAYEGGEVLEVENIRKYSRLHPRCGTSFLLIVMIVSIFLFAFLGWPNFWMRIISRVILMPVVAGISYELIRWAGKETGNRLVCLFSAPGMWLQKLTTREPEDDQIEVAIYALQGVIAEED
jgi:uncharacterized protein YqhQ